VFWIASLHDRPDFQRRPKAIRQTGAHEPERT
jgi:hypothetical protein